MGELTNSISPKMLIELSEAGANIAVVDVRKLPAFEGSGRLIPGALWRDHQQVEIWGATYDSGLSLIVYCVHGHEVSQNVVATLLSMGVEARYLQGGFDAWLKAGGSAIEFGKNEG